MLINHKLYTNYFIVNQYRSLLNLGVNNLLIHPLPHWYIQILEDYISSNFSIERFHNPWFYALDLVDELSALMWLVIFEAVYQALTDILEFPL